jgi:hypothetical protein
MGLLEDEFEELRVRLTEERPRLSAFELDSLWGRCRTRALRTAGPGANSRKERFMRTRLAITSMLAIGVLFIFTGGAAMAVAGSSGSGSAGSAQYPTPAHHVGHLGPPTVNLPPPDGPPPQLSTPTGSSSLPFTGLVLIPLIILGVALLVIGLVLRSRSTRAPNA